jgi:dihydroxy-acid dehydratase
MTFDPRHQSRGLVDGPDRAAARSYFKAIGFTDEDLKRPLVGVAHCWIEITPCNWNHRKLAEKVKEGIRAAGGTPIEFNTISITDGIAMGTEGMKASLISREAIADSVELVVRGPLLDGFVGISGCDKTIPAMVMAMARLNLPSTSCSTGLDRLRRSYKGRASTIQECSRRSARSAPREIDAKELNEIRPAVRGDGASGGQVTVNTMSRASAMLGVSPMGFNGVTATDPRKEEVAFETGKLAMEILKKGLLPRQIITRKSLHNSIAGVMATGGSTNAVLHLLAVAKEAGVKLDIDEFDKVSRKRPCLPTWPWGNYRRQRCDAGV